jgi:predicted nuclease of predicted toxin-antitoxin system
MLFLIDECFPKRMVMALRQLGHDVVWAHEICPGRDDIGVLATATGEGRIVVTEDRDYGDLTMRDGHPAKGIVIAHAARFPGGVSEAVLALCTVIDQLGSSLCGHLTVIEPGRVRQRPLPRAT